MSRTLQGVVSVALSETVSKTQKEKAYIRRYGLKCNTHTGTTIVLSEKESI